MSEEIGMALEEATSGMNKAIDHLEFELNKIRAGKASPAMLDSVKVDYYGSMTPLKNVANVSTPDARTITVQAWEKHMLEAIDKAIEETRRQFRLGKAPPPSAATRARFSGVSSGSSGAAAKTGPTKVELTKEDRIMARAAFPKLKEKDAYREYAKLQAKGADA